MKCTFVRKDFSTHLFHQNFHAVTKSWFYSNNKEETMDFWHADLSDSFYSCFLSVNQAKNIFLSPHYVQSLFDLIVGNDQMKNFFSLECFLFQDFCQQQNNNRFLYSFHYVTERILFGLNQDVTLKKFSKSLSFWILTRGGGGGGGRKSTPRNLLIRKKFLPGLWFGKVKKTKQTHTQDSLDLVSHFFSLGWYVCIFQVFIVLHCIGLQKGRPLEK